MSFWVSTFLLFMMTSCSLMNFSANKREISSVTAKKIKFDQQELSLVAGQAAQMYWEIYEVAESRYIGVTDKKVDLLDLEYVVLESHRLADLDQFAEVETVKDRLVLRSYFGVFLTVSSDKINRVATLFPVASFEYVDGMLHLYNANNHGRFCDSEELRKSLPQRDRACQNVEKRIPLD